MAREMSTARKWKSFTKSKPKDLYETEAAKASSLLKRCQWTKLHRVLSRIQQYDDARIIFDKIRDDTTFNILHLLCRKNAPSATVLSVLSQFPHLASETDGHGHLPLHTAAAYGLPHIITRALLVVYPESALAQDHAGRTPLIAACQSQSSGLVDGLSATPPGVQFAVDYFLHNQIVYELLQPPLNGITIVDSRGLNALDYAIHVQAPASVVTMLQGTMAVEAMILAELSNTRRRTRLPKMLSVLDHESSPNDSKEAFDSESQGAIASVLNQYADIQLWKPSRQTSRDLPNHSKKRRTIYARMNSIKLGCDPKEELYNSLNYRKAMTAFLGVADCEEHFNRDFSAFEEHHATVFESPFERDIPLVIDVVLGEEDIHF